MTSNELEIFKQSILDDVRVMMQTTGQVTQYIGARYVPLFAEPLDWSAEREYEPLTIVLDHGNSFTSRQFVPKGVDISDESFWANTGNYNAQIEQYRLEVEKFKKMVELETERATKEELKISSDFVNIKSLGAVGDGVTDNTDVFNRAFSTLTDIYIPEGDYLIERPLTIENAINVVGSGRRSIIRTSNTFSGNIITIRLNKTGHDNHLGLTLKDFSIVPYEYNGDTNFGDGTTTSNAIYFDITDPAYWVSYATIDNITFGSFNGNFIHLNNTQIDGLFNTKIINCKSYGGGLYLYRFGDSNVIESNSFSGKGKIIISNVEGAYSSKVINNNITVTGGVQLLYSQLLFENNQMECTGRFDGDNDAYLTINGTEIIVNNCNLNIHDNDISCIYCVNSRYSLISNMEIYNENEKPFVMVDDNITVDNIYFIHNNTPFFDYPFGGKGFPYNFPVKINNFIEGFNNNKGVFIVSKDINTVDVSISLSNNNYVNIEAGTAIVTLPFKIIGGAPFIGYIENGSKCAIAKGSGNKIIIEKNDRYLDININGKYIINDRLY